MGNVHRRLAAGCSHQLVPLSRDREAPVDAIQLCRIYLLDKSSTAAEAAAAIRRRYSVLAFAEATTDRLAAISVATAIP